MGTSLAYILLSGLICWCAPVGIGVQAWSGLPHPPNLPDQSKIASTITVNQNSISEIGTVHYRYKNIIYEKVGCRMTGKMS